MNKIQFPHSYSCKVTMLFLNCRMSVVNLVVIVCLFLVAHHRGVSGKIFSNQFAVHIPGGSGTANEIASKHDFTNLGQIFPDYYHFVHRKVAKRSVEPCHEYHERLSSEPEVRWHQQQKVKRRTKRDFLQLSPKQVSLVGGGRSRTVKRSRVVSFNDPRWPAMWYLNRGPGLDMNVHEAWRDEGITGKGIVVTILDDGLEKDHPDIVRNYDPMASFDVNSLDMDPMPTYDLTDSNRHGTRCAGEVAAEANNSICAVGVAYEASVGGVRMLDGDVTDAVEARSLSHNPQHIDIYSASWGPDDDGKTVDGPGELATRAFIEGVTKGRAGKGSIFVWASGNGGRDHDNCNCDGYTNSIWTLSISSATENGLVPWYSEACSSTLATTYSSGGTGEKQGRMGFVVPPREIVTIDLHHSCTSSHTGTSASAPLAAGICALALQANTNLTWRDMQHIVVRTARPQNLIAPDWATNGVGRNVSHSFGYGLMDAGAMVRLAKKWKTIPEQNKCEVRAPYSDKNIPAKSKVTLDLKVTNCSGVNFLEHVQAKVTLTSGRRGDLQIYLVSPSGTRSTLLAHRRHDLSRSGFTDWPFMTVHCWGENPIGKWTLEIHNEGRYAGKLQTWTLIAHGITDNPNEPNTNKGKEVAKGVPSSVREGVSDNRSGSEAIVDFDGSENSIVSHVHSPSMGVDTAVAADVPVSTSSTSSDCVKSSVNGQCIDCSPDFSLFHGQCIRSCPETFYGESQGPEVFSVETKSQHSSVCMPCHYSCKSCQGPHDYECTSCHNDANLHTISRLGIENGISVNESHCYPAVLVDTLNSNAFWYKTLLVTVFVNVSLVTILIAYILWFQRRGPGDVKRGGGHLLARRSYRRVSPDEDHPNALDVDLGSEEDSEDDDSHHLEQFTSQHAFVVKNPDLNSVHGLSLEKTNNSKNHKIVNQQESQASQPILPSMHSNNLPFS